MEFKQRFQNWQSVCIMKNMSRVPENNVMGRFDGEKNPKFKNLNGAKEKRSKL